MALVVTPIEPSSTSPIDQFAASLAGENDLESANARDCFVTKQGFDCGVVVVAFALQSTAKHEEVGAEFRKQADAFVRKHKEKFEQALVLLCYEI